MGLFVLGILFGWLVEWLFYNFYWKPNHGNSASSSDGEVMGLKQQLAEKSTEIVTLKSKISAAVTDVKPKLKKSTVKKATADAAVKKKPVIKKSIATGSPVKNTSAKKKVVAKKSKTLSFEKEMQKISGIGPKLSSTLAASGFDNFKKLADAKPDDLKKVISRSGTKYAMIDVSSWPEQAGYLDKGDSAGFEKLLGSLKN